MKKLFWLALPMLLLATPMFAQSDYYFPNHTAGFDSSIPTPEEFLGYPIGSHYTRHDRIVAYFAELARLSDKATFEVIGKTYEERPQVVLTITSPENHARLEAIRQEHLTLVDPDAPELNYAELPVIVHLGYSVHGAETSSGEAALLTAYYLIASQSPETQTWLNEAVITMDPALNPDGRDSMATWHNQYKSFPPVADPNDAEHNAAWPGGRTNHFWFDLNRDWLPAVHVESQARLEFFHRWYPNVMIDFHEMGTNSTYYFEPSPPLGSESPIVPKENYSVLNVKLAEYHAKALDEIGALYFTKEVFDNFSPIYGSTYPDFQGGLGITFEVGSSRGLVQESQDGLKTFAETILRHVTTGIATVYGSVEEKELLLEFQRDFFQSALTDADAIINEIQWFRPVEIGGCLNSNGEAHYWVILGYSDGHDPPQFLMNMGWGDPPVWNTWDAVANSCHNYITQIAPRDTVRFVGNTAAGDGSPDNPHKDIEEAIQQAPDGATLIFKAGSDNTFSSRPLTISKPLTLKGYNVILH